MVKGICPKNWLLQPGCWMDPLGSALLEWIKMRTPGLEYYLKTRVGSLSAGVPAPQHSLHEEKRPPKALLSTASWDGQSVGPWAPLCPDPFRVHGWWDTENHWESLLGGVCDSSQCAPLWQQEECIKELHLELAWCMARTGLQSGPRSARPTSQSRGCSHGWDQSPSSDPHGVEAAKCPREDPSIGWSRRWHSHSKSQNHSQRHWSPLPQPPRRCQSPSSPMGSHPADKHLSHSLGDLHLHPKPWKFQSRV